MTQKMDYRKGDHSHHHKLTEAKVLEIRTRFQTEPWTKKADLAREYDVSRSTVVKLLANKIWRVEGEAYWLNRQETDDDWVKAVLEYIEPVSKSNAGNLE